MLYLILKNDILSIKLRDLIRQFILINLQMASKHFKLFFIEFLKVLILR
jgi:hypothetical protein